MFLGADPQDGPAVGGSAETEQPTRRLYHVLASPTEFSSAYIKRAWKLIARDGGPREVRILKTEKDGTVSGIFTDPEQVATAVASWDGVKSIYLTPNPLKPEMLSRENVGKLTRWTKDTTTDTDIARRAWLIGDVDPVTPVKHISATDEERDRSLEVRDQIAAWLTDEYGFPDPIRGRSGNGGRLLYSIDLPNDTAAADLVKRCLQALATRWNSEQVQIDTSVYNASRVDKVWGTMAVKGADDIEHQRPWRRSFLDAVPKSVGVVGLGQLEKLAALVPPKSTSTSSSPPNSEAGQDFPELLEGFKARDWYLSERGDKHLVLCPWKDTHSVDSGPTETALYGPSAKNNGGGFKCQHSHCTGRTISDVYRLLIEPKISHPSTKRPVAVDGASGVEVEGHGLKVYRMSDVSEEPDTWLWRGRFPSAALSLVCGNPGDGKSFVSIDLASRLSRGDAWPDGVKSEGSGVTIFLSTEDALTKTMKKRFRWSGADQTKILVVRGVIRKDDPVRTRKFSLIEDLDRMRRLVKETGNVKSIVIDPVNSYLGKKDNYRDTDVRDVLDPIAALAEELDIAIIGIMHLSKAAQTTVLFKVSGSVGFTGVARVVFFVSRDKEVPTRRHMTCAKVNDPYNGVDPDSRAFRINPLLGRVEWEPEATGVTAAEATREDAPIKKESQPSREQVIEWLQGYLADGKRAQGEVIAAAREMKITYGQIKTRRFKEEAGVETYEERNEKGQVIRSWWRLLSPEPEPHARVDSVSESGPVPSKSTPKFTFSPLSPNGDVKVDQAQRDVSSAFTTPQRESGVKVEVDADLQDTYPLSHTHSPQGYVAGNALTDDLKAVPRADTPIMGFLDPNDPKNDLEPWSGEPGYLP